MMVIGKLINVIIVLYIIYRSTPLSRRDLNGWSVYSPREWAAKGDPVNEMFSIGGNLVPARYLAVFEI